MKRKPITTFVAAFGLLVLLFAMAPRDATDTRDYAALDNSERANREAWANRAWPTPRPTMAATPKPIVKEKNIMANKVPIDGCGAITLSAGAVTANTNEWRIDSPSLVTYGAEVGNTGGITVSFSGDKATVCMPSGFSAGSGWTLSRKDVQPNTPDYYYDTQFEVVCLLAKLTLTVNATDVYTATAFYEGTPTGAVTYAFTLPADATDISETGNTRQFKSFNGGVVNVTITDSDTPNPCTAEAQADTNDATGVSGGGGGSGTIELGGFAPTLTRAPALDTALYAAFSFTEPYVNDPTPDDAACAGINIARWAVAYDCQNFLEKARATAAFEQAHFYRTVAETNATIYLEFYSTAYNVALRARGDYKGRAIDESLTRASNPFRTIAADGDNVFYSETAFVTVPAKADAPVDPVAPPEPVDPTTTGPDGCCLPGYYREVAGGPCIAVPAPPEPIDPTFTAPDAPIVARDCGAAALVVTSPAFPANAVSLEAQRDDGALVVHVYSTAGAWNDTSAAILTNYRYRLRSVGADGGKSAWGAYSIVAALKSDLPAPVWVATTPGSTPQGRVTLIATAPPRAQLHATTPLTMKLWGGDLPVTFNAKTGQWVATIDTRMEYQGEVTIALQIRDLAGCYSAVVPLAFTINNSIERGARWSEKASAAAFTAELEARGDQITDVGYYAQIDVSGTLSAQRYYRWYVTAPDPGAATPAMLADYAAMRDRVKDWQDIAPDATARLNVPATSARLAMESLDAEIMTLFALEGPPLKLRQLAPDSVEIVTTRGYYGWSDGGLTTLASWADLEKPSLLLNDNVRDAAKVENKIYVALENDSRVIVIDLGADKISAVLLPYGETRDLVALENWNGVPIAVYSDANNATGYSLGTSIDDEFVLPSPVVRAWAREGRLFLASADDLLEIGLAGAVTTAPAGTAPTRAVEVYVDASGSETNETIVNDGSQSASAPQLRAGTESGAVVVVGTPPVIEASSMGGAVAGIAHFKGGADAPREIYAMNDGPNVARLFVRENGAVTPQWTLKDGDSNEAMKTIDVARVLTTLREPSGDPLKGGDAGLISESLLAAFTTSGGGYLARIQEADVDKSRTKRARAILEQNFKGVGFRPVPVVV